MGIYETAIRPLMFRLEPETAHELATLFLRRGLLKTRPFDHPSLAQSLLGVSFRNPLGLAAGFDKNAVALDFWHQLGFGFVEAGTITLHPQPGNPRPRLFRLPNERGLINRMGFNNDGAKAAAERLAAANPRIPVGINLGKSKAADLSAAPADYQESFRLLHPFGAYFVVNVSSPNTPGLRDLQEKGPLLDILGALREVDASRPLLIKVSPDLAPSALDGVVEVAREAKAAGIIATNTTISREPVPPGTPNRDEEGGLSGGPLRDLARQALRHLYRTCGQDMVLIGVGGILDGDDLYDRIADGAHLCQVYTGWVYGGPGMVPKALQRLAERMDREGIKSLGELRGSAAGQ